MALVVAEVARLVPVVVGVPAAAALPAVLLRDWRDGPAPVKGGTVVADNWTVVDVGVGPVVVDGGGGTTAVLILEEGGAATTITTDADWRMMMDRPPRCV